jgi:hypothetical protein
VSMKQIMVSRDISHIAKANQIASSLRTTVPKKIVDGLHLQVGDIVEWELHTDKGMTVAYMKKL